MPYLISFDIVTITSYLSFSNTSSMQRIIIYLLFVLVISCKKENQPPKCSITQPEDNFVCEFGEDIFISIEASDPDGLIQEIHLYIDGYGISALKEFPYTHIIESEDYTPGKYLIKATALDNEGLSTSDEIHITINSRLAVVTTAIVTSITDTSAVSGGNITEDGGAEILSRGVCCSTSPNPTITDKHSEDGNGSGEYISSISGLNQNTIYYIRAYATNNAGTSYGNELSFTTFGIVIDYDGNQYFTIQIGDQIWMAENLKTTRYADGSAIPLVTGTSAWDALTAASKAYCWYYNSTAYRDTYGGLYTWAAAMNGASSSSANPSGIQGVCPDGWHLPSDGEWKQLEMYLGMSQAQADNIGWRGTDQGGKLKESGISHWSSPNTGATNSSGFTALPGGMRYTDGVFDEAGYDANFWAATEDVTSSAWRRYLGFNMDEFYRHPDDKKYGFSVRCVKD